jgi:hypothetical protein
MNFQKRRGLRGAVRATPEDILREAIAAHAALRDRERLRGAGADAEAKAPSAKAAPRRRETGVDGRRAQFAAAMARSVFGRFYRTEPAKKNK